MTDKEWIENLPSVSNEALMETLDYFGYDSYYRTCREPLVAEIAKRLTKNEQLKKQVEEMRCCGNCSHRHYWGNELGCNLDYDKEDNCNHNNKKYWEFMKE